MAPGPNPAEHVRSVGLVYQLVSEFVTPIVLGLLVDWQFGTKPWGTLVGTSLGLLLGLFRVRQILRQMDAEANSRSRKP